jgi:hypothetical protein
MIIQNAIETPDGTILVSRHVHDYVTHTDVNKEEYMNDGGREYLRRSVNKEPATDLTLYDTDPFEVIREKLLRGSRGKDGTEPLKYIKLKDIDYLDDLIEYEETNRPDNIFLKYYKQEKEYRGL